MFFKEYFKSIADIIEAKYKGHITLNQNNADKGELCEIFVKDFLFETLDDSFKIARGGKVIDHCGNSSKQIDIVVLAKKSLKLFYDKGIYPTETVYGVVSVTSNLDKAKVLDCCEEFISIPKQNYKFFVERFVDEKYAKETEGIWKTLVPYKVIFAYSGNIRKEWIDEIMEINKTSFNPLNTTPDLIIVNKKGFIEKTIFQDADEQLNFSLKFVPFNDNYKNYGVPFSKMLFHLNTLAHEEIILKPKLEYYFDQDI